MASYRTHLFVVLGVATNLVGCNSGWYSDEGLDEGSTPPPRTPPAPTPPRTPARTPPTARRTPPTARPRPPASTGAPWHSAPPRGRPPACGPRGRPGPFQVDPA
ncbi:MAG: hypothetical protein R3F43_27160 [bacterium]